MQLTYEKQYEKKVVCPNSQYSWKSRQKVPGWPIHPMRPQEKIYEWQWSDATDAGKSHDNNMAKVVHPDYIHTI